MMQTASDSTVRLPGIRFFLLALLALGSLANVHAEAIPLVPGKTVSGLLNLAGREESRRYRITVPENAYSLSIVMESDQRALELALFDADGRPLLASRSLARQESIVLDRLGNPEALTTGVYEVEVYLGPDLEQRESARFSLRCDLVLGGQLQALSPGTATRDVLTPARGMFQLFEYPVPAGVEHLRLDLYDNHADLDLFILPTANPDPGKALRSSRRMHGSESLVLSVADLPRLGASKPPTLYAMVLAPWDASAQGYSLRLSHGREAPADLRRLPVFKVQPRGMARAIGATVELFTPGGAGSGCIIHPSGIIVTNRHVVTNSDDSLAATVEVAICTNPALPAKVSFVARVLEESVERDLALLKITGGFYGGELPVDYSFPWLESGAVERLQLGDTLQVLGYPGIGSLDSRATITYTRGVLSGFQRSPWGSLLKTDAEINAGSSGGACLDQYYRLVGLPTQVVGEGSGQLAFVTTLASLPESWKVWLQAPR